MKKSWEKKIITRLLLIAIVIDMVIISQVTAGEFLFTDNQLANAIYLAEGGAKTRHPYGILAHYQHTTPRQACINTIRHCKRDWNGEGDFLEFLQKRYAPTVGATNDPTNLNKNWLKNVRYFLGRAK